MTTTKPWCPAARPWTWSAHAKEEQQSVAPRFPSRHFSISAVLVAAAGPSLAEFAGWLTAGGMLGGLGAGTFASFPASVFLGAGALDGETCTAAGAGVANTAGRFSPSSGEATATPNNLFGNRRGRLAGMRRPKRLFEIGAPARAIARKPALPNSPYSLWNGWRQFFAVIAKLKGRFSRRNPARLQSTVFHAAGIRELPRLVARRSSLRGANE